MAQANGVSMGQSTGGSSRLKDDRVLALTRGIAGLVVPILVVAFVMLYLLPNRAGELFAWGVSPPMSAMMLGATYLGGAYFFTRVLMAKRWHTIALGLLPVTAFATYLGIATLLHWDRFTPGHVSFILWAILYLSLPFILPMVYLRNRATDPGAPDAATSVLPAWIRWVFGLEGAGLVAVSLMLLALPAVMIPTWPWTLSPLTARVMGAMFVLPGLVGLGIAFDGRWSAARTILEAQVGAIVLILLAVTRAGDAFDWSRFVSWMFVGGMCGLAAVLVAIYVAMERRPGSVEGVQA